jgi:Domain of Unknown Function with PDB structure (DUF3857)
MKRLIFFLVFLCVFYNGTILAQSTLPEYGNYSNEEIMMTKCAFDTSADAVVLLDEAFSYYDDEYHLITDRRIRIKILDARALDKGTIRVRYYSKNNFETITKIEGMTYTPGGSPQISTINKKSIFTEKEDERVSSKKFAMPNIKAGSIIEYKYESVMEHFGGLDHWLFQADIPTVKSCFRLQIVPNATFSYIVSKKGDYKVIIVPSEGGIYFEMNSVPGLRFEPYMDAPKDYLQRVEFQLAGYKNRFGDKKDVNSSWKQVAFDLATDDDLGGTVKKNLPIPLELTANVAAEPGSMGKINVIYDYVKDHFTWDGYYGIYATDGVNKVWEKRMGSAGELNLVLINLLQSFKIDASPLLVAERDYGKVDPANTFIDRFNKTVAYVEVDGKLLVLDATQKYCPASLIPYPLLNTLALVVNKKTKGLIEIGSGEAAYKYNARVSANLDKAGLLKGSCIVNSVDYARESEIERIKNDKDNKVVKTIEESYEGLKVDSFEYVYANKDTVPLLQQFNFNDQLNENGGFVLFNYNFFTGLDKNPFKADERFTDIDFGYPFDVEVEEKIELPANSKTDNLLKSKILQTADKNIILSREIGRAGNILNIKIHFLQSVTLVPSSSYDALKGFYQQMNEMLNEPIVIKLE